MTTTTASPAPARAALGRRALQGSSLAATLELALIGVLSFVPLLAIDPGVVTSDTKTYLYLDPARFLAQVTKMWYPTVALGTVTHQYVGYLLPMGPYYVAMAALHVPTWIAQRLWLGAIVFAAGTGVAYLCRVFSVRRPGTVVAALAYMLSPYLLQYAARTSVILLPWAGLPWMLAFTVVALRRGGWRAPAAFALVIALVSGINASSILYVVIAPCLWLVYAVAVEREASWRRALAVLAKIAVLSVLVSAWWVVGLAVEAGYGVDILQYTESVSATSSTSSTLEVLRGLGYWYFYGGGRLGPWTQSVVLYTKWVWLVALSYFVPLLAVVTGVSVRWRARAYFVVLVVVGVVLSVGAYPYTHPSAVGGALKAFMTGTTAGLAMRSTDRATPLVVLGLAVLLGAGVSALELRRSWVGWATAVVIGGLVIANNPAMFNGDAEVVSPQTQPAALPRYELAALHHLSSVEKGTRVLAIPGDDFAAYTWGETYDTPQPAVLTRPFVTREQQIMGSMPTADMLFAEDAPIQTATENWSALAPMASLMSAGNVLVEYDQDSALYGVPPARVLARSLASTPKGLSAERDYGVAGQRVAKATLDPEVLSTLPLAQPSAPSPLVTYRVSDPRPVTRAESNQGAVVVAGDATGLEELAAQGLLDTKSAIYYAGTLDTRPAQLRTLAAQGATLVVTDTNRKEGFRWNALSANTGFVETASDDTTRTTPTDSPLELFPGAPGDAKTVATYIGALNVTASSYGNSVTYTPEQRAAAAIDGNLRTAWETGTYVSDVAGQWWQVQFGHRATANHVVLVQPQGGTRKRTITKVTLSFTGRPVVTVPLGPRSRHRSGQRVDFSRRSFRTLRVTIDATSSQKGTPVGFAEVEVPGQRVVEVDQLPDDLLSSLGKASRGDRLIVTMTRARVSPYSTRSDPQSTLSRSFTLPTARTFTLSGTATLSKLVSDDQLDRLVGVPGSTGSGVVAFSSGRLTGDLEGTAGAIATTAATATTTTATAATATTTGTGQVTTKVAGAGTPVWQPPFGAKDNVGAWLEYDTPAPVTFDQLTLGVVADRRHSVPRAVTISVQTAKGAHATSRTLTLPTIVRNATPGTTVTVPLHFPALSGSRIKITMTKVATRRGTLAGGTRTEVLPVGITEVALPGVRTGAVPADLPGTCESNLLSIDGHPLTVAVVGPSATALAEGQVTVRPCGADADGIRLSAGHHVVESALPTTPSGLGLHCASGAGCGGWNVDELTLDSAPGGGAAPDAAATLATTPAGTRSLSPPRPGKAPSVGVSAASATAQTVSVRGATRAFELVLGESVNPGWRAVAHPAPGAPPGSRSVTLGRPELVDGFANGWPVGPAALRDLGAGATGGRFEVSLTWTPQREVWAGLAVSAVSIAACMCLAFLPSRWRRTLRRRLRLRNARPVRSAPLSATREASTVAGPLVPELGWPVGAPGRPSAAVTAVVSVVTGGLAAAITDPLAGVAVAVAVAAGLAARRLRVAGALAAVGLLAAAAAVVVAGQIAHPAPGGGNWPSAYNDAAVLASIAVAFFGADAVVDYARRRAGRR